LTPMMLGVVFGAAISGQLLSRTGGHYRVQGLIGIAIMLAGVGMLARVSEDTGRAQAVAAAVIMGFGLGNTFPVFTIAVQNSVPQKFMGIATSSTQFFRSIGGTIGLAVLGAIMVSRFKAAVAASMPAEAAPLLSNGPVARFTDNPNALVDPNALRGFREVLASAPPEVAARVLEALRVSLAGAIGDVFIVTFFVIAGAFLITIALKEVPLRQRAPARGHASVSDRAAGASLTSRGSKPAVPETHHGDNS
ncbi:MAG: hypothetical protein HY678_00530, partial [Chloroflexi bacterium]|nr:hypothetical protein [Chloroflexota bacterium]